MKVKISASIEEEVYKDILSLSRALGSNFSYALNLAAKIGIRKLREIVGELEGKRPFPN